MKEIRQNQEKIGHYTHFIRSSMVKCNFQSFQTL
jgi:hypothetical protein